MNDAAPNRRLGGLLSPTFQGLLITQFLTATNDNIFRWLAIGIGKDYVQPENVGYVLMAGTACFVLPYILLAAPAGYFGDRYPKRDVIVLCKIAEIFLMALGIVGVVVGQPILTFATLALMGAQSALFSPAKMGSIPESLKPEHISMANGLFGLATVAATVVGMVAGNWLKDRTGEYGQTDWWISALVVVGVAVAGTISSLAIRRLPAGNPALTFPWNAFSQTVADLKTLGSNRALLRVSFGMVFFWAVGALAQLNIDQFAFEGGATSETAKAPLLVALVVGLGFGSVLAGIWSGGHVELGILPLGAFGVALNAMLLFLVQGEIVEPGDPFTASFAWACLLLFLLGTSSGLFSVPLDAFLQHRSPPESRGAILAAANFLIFAGILVSSVIFAALRTPALTGEPLFSARAIFLLAGLATVPVFAYIVWLIPQASLRFLVWLLSQTVYRIRVYGHEHLPARGGALLVCNHVSWLDAILLMMSSSRRIRMIAWGGNFQSPWMRWLAVKGGVILLGTRPKELVASLKEAREALLQGELVCIFPEGGITRTGQLQSFRPGLVKILKGTDVPAVPVYLDGLWGSIFSFERGKFFWKMPKRWPYSVYIHFGPAVNVRDDVYVVRRAVQDLGARAVQQRLTRKVDLVTDFIRMCKRRGKRLKVADSDGTKLSAIDTLLRSLIVRRLLKRGLIGPDEQHVGLLIPPSVGGVLANVALALDRRVAVNLNYTVSSEVINACIRQAGIKHVITSKRFMSKMNLKVDADLIYLEDLRSLPTTWDKVSAATAAYGMPTSLLARSLGLHKIKPDDPLTVIFTSGSTGIPKGVVLTHANVAHNVEAIEQVVHITADDVILGILPFFHSFGFTVTLWTVLSIDVMGVYHYSPLDARQIGRLCKEHKVTIMLSTPTFLRSYLKRCEKEDFASIDVVVAGAEKLPKELCDAFEAKFGIRPVEGYGTTELSPLVSVNVPPSRSRAEHTIDRKEGTVGLPVPGVSAKITDLETGKELPAGQAGMLWIGGPNVMKGYLNRPDATSEVIKDGWYMTGDVAFIDDDGFITITGRESRFSKIGGEMVPHMLIEDALNKVIGANEEEGLKAVVTAVPDERKGERLVVIHVKLEKTPGELCKGLTAAGLPNLYIPSEDCFVEVDRIPILGTGKMDLKGMRQVAEERVTRK